MSPKQRIQANSNRWEITQGAMQQPTGEILIKEGEGEMVSCSSPQRAAHRPLPPAPPRCMCEGAQPHLCR